MVGMDGCEKASWLMHKRGVTREVFLVHNYAVKIPSLRSWKLFLQGLLCNIQESTFSGYSNKLCPVIFKLPGGFLNVMPRCESLEDESLMFLEADNLEIEQKLCSFGWLNDEVVAVDYGS